MIRYFSGIVTCTFKAESLSRGSKHSTGFGGGCGSSGGRFGVFPAAFVLYSNDLPY